MKKYVVYRVYSSKERPNRKERRRYYGWSYSKPVIKAFLQQRNEKKYMVLKVDTDEIGNITEDIDDEDCMIDYISIRSTSGDEYSFFITKNELQECEIGIQQMMLDQASLTNIDGDGNYLNMFIQLDNYYADALYFIGYRPKELDALYPSADYHDDYASIETLEEMIGMAYSCPILNPDTEEKEHLKIAGLDSGMDVANKLYYSLESFVKVLRDDL